LAVLILAAGPCWGQLRNKSDEDKIVQMEKQLWEAWKNHKSEPFNQYLSSGSVSVTPAGLEDKTKTLEEMSQSDCKVESFSLENTKVTWVNRDTALLTYKGNQDAVCKGQKIPSSVWASSIWVKRGSQWQAMFHQETATEEAMKSMRMETRER